MLTRGSHANHLFVDEMGRHADQRQFEAQLRDGVVRAGEWNQASEPFKGNLFSVEAGQHQASERVDAMSGADRSSGHGSTPEETQILLRARAACPCSDCTNREQSILGYPFADSGSPRYSPRDSSYIVAVGSRDRLPGICDRKH